MSYCCIHTAASLLQQPSSWLSVCRVFVRAGAVAWSKGRRIREEHPPAINILSMAVSPETTTVSERQCKRVSMPRNIPESQAPNSDEIPGKQLLACTVTAHHACSVSSSTSRSSSIAAILDDQPPERYHRVLRQVLLILSAAFNFRRPLLECHLKEP